jgi:tRNA dimethylallyltransferase
VGKTEWSLVLAEAMNGEIVSADSRLVYRGMDIGTAKPSPAEMARVPHHLIDILDPSETLGLAEFQRLARAAIDAIHARGRLPLLVGGTGQYVWALLEGWTAPPVPADPARRAALEGEAARIGREALHARLATLDPDAAALIDARNVRRTIRALEVIEATGQLFSAQRRKVPPPYEAFIAGLTRPRPELYARIDARIDAMMAAGLLEEVAGLAAAGHGWEVPSMSGVGYRQLGYYLRGEIGLDEAVALIKRETRRFVRHQANWYREDDARIRWFEAERAGPEELAAAVQVWLRRMPTGPNSHASGGNP